MTFAPAQALSSLFSMWVIASGRELLIVLFRRAIAPLRGRMSYGGWCSVAAPLPTWLIVDTCFAKIELGPTIGSRRLRPFMRSRFSWVCCGEGVLLLRAPLRPNSANWDQPSAGRSVWLSASLLRTDSDRNHDSCYSYLLPNTHQGNRGNPARQVEGGHLPFFEAAPSLRPLGILVRINSLA
jgi:hypothetical protein